MFPDLESFFEAARTLKLTQVEKKAAWDSIAASMYGREELLLDDKMDIRSVLKNFSRDFSLQSLVPVAQITPLSPWTGVNLFGHLQPFSI